ncbi:MAG: chemotaxis protein CheW [Isosphaeraceae bacterium]|nr:chemotaxis protein CheW [Isosphaeraceae bacterium]
MVFEVGGRRFGLPATELREIVRAVTITPLPQGPAAIEGVIDVRGDVVPVIDLRRLLGMPSRPVALSDHLVITRLEGAPLALWIDRAIEVRSDEAGDDPGHERVVRLADGLVPVVELRDLLEAEEWLAVRAWLGREGPA